MIQHFTNVSYLLCAIMVTVTNPALTSLLIFSAILSGRIGEITALLTTGTISLAYMTPALLLIGAFVYIGYTLKKERW